MAFLGPIAGAGAEVAGGFLARGVIGRAVAAGAGRLAQFARGAGAARGATAAVEGAEAVGTAGVRAAGAVAKGSKLAPLASNIALSSVLSGGNKDRNKEFHSSIDTGGMY